MEKIAVLIDSTSFLSEELKKELDIRTVYLNIVINNHSYKEIIDMTADKYYEYLRDTNNSFTTCYRRSCCLLRKIKRRRIY